MNRARLLFALPLLLSVEIPARGQERVASRKVEETLSRTLGGVWARIPRRVIIDKLASAAKVAVLVDRRIDPTVELTLDALGQPLRTVFAQASPPGTLVSVVADVVYLGPGEPAAKLRTAAALREAELKTGETSKSRQAVLLRPHDIAWQDLDTPRQIIEQIATKWDLKVEAIEQVPHDLWQGAVLPNVSAPEALSLVLVQFDLTFGWTAGGTGVRIVPLPEKVVIVRQHAPAKGLTAKASATQWMDEYPGLEANAEGTRVLVTGTLEQHEALAGPRRPVKETTSTPSKVQPLARVRFTLKWDNVLRDLFATLHQAPDAQLTFEYDEPTLKAAGVDLDQRVKFEVNNATVSQLLKAAFDPVGIQFTLQDRTVKLSPKNPAKPKP